MDKQKWEALCASIRGENTELSCGLIVDSPWIPGYCGISNIDFYVDPQKWFDSYMKTVSYTHLTLPTRVAV